MVKVGEEMAELLNRKKEIKEEYEHYIRLVKAERLRQRSLAGFVAVLTPWKRL